MSLKRGSTWEEEKEEGMGRGGGGGRGMQGGTSWGPCILLALQVSAMSIAKAFLNLNTFGIHIHIEVMILNTSIVISPKS